MPSIEILSIDQVQPIEVARFPFAVLPDDRRRSRRSHRSKARFQEDFDRVSGILYHLGNPNLKSSHSGRLLFAYELLSEDSKHGANFLEFAPDYRIAAQSLLAELMAGSPVHRLLFTSDWQFGPEWTRREPAVTLDEFWRLHDARRVLLNALYPMEQDQ